ncbi:hypothetical protein F7734_36595 [Scytonema sp. UIC 10036]|uniref:hypothetical protein n=1 Tax=Scytonema sp. UIC 10036 TaxID=2304196 RepID=UPI0012DA1E1C|nr:hypothetical protein [Scytonema sp. UIC 10036]MUG97550.1 hypothetical protein [Scytonema sp. UIC 10036]
MTLAEFLVEWKAGLTLPKQLASRKLPQLPAQNTIDLRFSSPTSFKQVKNVQPFPLPDLVFNGLLRR